MNPTRSSWVVAAAVSFSCAWLAQGGSSQAPYRNPALPIAERAEDLLGRMTLEEKVGHMNMPCVYEEGLGRTISEW